LARYVVLFEASRQCIGRREWHLEALASELLNGDILASPWLKDAPDGATVDTAKAALADHEGAAEVPGGTLELLEGKNAEIVGSLRQR
jgi:hypothetical protein